MSKLPSSLIQERMDAYDRRWRWLTFCEYVFSAGALCSLLWLVFELCCAYGVVTVSWMPVLVGGLLAIGAVLAFMIIAVVVVARETRRAWLADRLERGHPGLLDRLNALIFLDLRRKPGNFALKRRIEAQAAEVLDREPAKVHLSSRRAWERFGEFALLLAAAVLFGVHYHPFARLVAPTAGTRAAKNEAPFELVPGNVNEQAKTQKPWGEVRIVAPGRDMKLTKIDVLPLQIEMAASAPLENPAWITSVNGGGEVRHELPPSPEPQYAVYQPMIYLDELQVAEWDVVSYYAKAVTAAPAEYASQIYFIDIRPFREDILKQTGGAGKGAKGRELLDEISALIKQQTVTLQQTHQYGQTTYPTDEMRKQDQKKLTASEGDLSNQADHLYGRIVAENENAPIGDVLDHLTQAHEQMDKATENLGEDVIPEAKQREQGALTQLVACRKSFYKVISDNPNAFGHGDDEPIATAEDSQKALAQVTEMHDRDEAALKSLHGLAQQQQQLAQNTPTENNGNGQAAARAETSLSNQVQKLMHDNPDLFRGAEPEKTAMQGDMAQAIDQLRQNEMSEGSHYLNHAAGDLSDLEKVAQKNHAMQQTAEAYALKKIIDQNIAQLAQEKAKPGTLTPEQKQALSDSARRSTGTLKEIADSPDHGGFGPGLSQSLSPPNQQQLQQSLDQLGQSQPGPGSQAAAGAAQGQLAQVSQAFDQSRPGQGQLAASGQQAGQADAAPGDALDQSAQRLQGLLLAQQKSNPPSTDQNGKELGEILGDLENDLSKKNTPEAAALLQEVQDADKKRATLPFNAGELKKLLAKIEFVSAEANDPAQAKPPGGEITNIDPDKLPASYRARIRVYYEQLSNQPQ